jgi:hypothetical protein
MIKKIIFLFFISIKLIECIRMTDFCFQDIIENKIIKCQETKNFSYECGQGICSIDRYSCQSMKLFSKVKDTQKNEKNYRYFENYYDTFLNQIKDCPAPPKYKWNSNDVCLNARDCFHTIRLLWSSIIKKGECKCKGNKYNYKCNSDYCASNKQACDHLKQIIRSKIKKC